MPGVFWRHGKEGPRAAEVVQRISLHEEMMILRVHVACPGCDTPTVLRIGIGVAPGEKQPVAVRCGQCGSTIRGELGTNRDADVFPNFEGILESPEDDSDWPVITTHPSFPFASETTMSPFIEISMVLGDATAPCFEAIAQFRSIASGDWLHLERAFQFYFAEGWERFDATMSRLLEEQWPANPSMLGRHDSIHRLTWIALTPLDPGQRYLQMQKELWARAAPNRSLAVYLTQEKIQTEVAALQRRIFRQIAHLVEIREMWLPAVPLLWLEASGRDVPETWKLPGEDFPILRGVYQQNFELSCQFLPLLVAVQNSADGREPSRLEESSSGLAWVPAGLPESVKQPPRTIPQFKKLTAEGREAYLEKYPVIEAAWFESFSRGIRNAIAHADVDEVVATGEIVTGKGERASYLSFVEAVVKQIQLLQLWLNFAKLIRIYAVLNWNE